MVILWNDWHPSLLTAMNLSTHCCVTHCHGLSLTGVWLGSRSRGSELRAATGEQVPAGQCHFLRLAHGLLFADFALDGALERLGSRGNSFTAWEHACGKSWEKSIRHKNITIGLIEYAMALTSASESSVEKLYHHVHNQPRKCQEAKWVFRIRAVNDECLFGFSKFKSKAVDRLSILDNLIVFSHAWLIIINQ